MMLTMMSCMDLNDSAQFLAKKGVGYGDREEGRGDKGEGCVSHNAAQGNPDAFRPLINTGSQPDNKT